MLQNVKYSQIESGLSELLLDHPAKHIPYLTLTWITSIRQFMFVHNLRITLTDSLKICLRGKHDQCIMKLEILQRYTVQQQVDINLVRLYLQVVTLSDASTQAGDEICNLHLRGERRPNQIIRKKTWPRQEPPTSSQCRLWRKYITSSFLRYGTKWKNQLGPLLMNRPPLIQYLPLSPGSSMTLKDYIKSLIVVSSPPLLQQTACNRSGSMEGIQCETSHHHCLRRQLARNCRNLRLEAYGIQTRAPV
jgi:hypothetical protein